jgi:hypothetical protein
MTPLFVSNTAITDASSEGPPPPNISIVDRMVDPVKIKTIRVMTRFLLVSFIEDREKEIDLIKLDTPARALIG